MIKPTSEKAAEYVWFAKECLKLKESGTKSLTDGSTVIVCKYTPDDAVLFVLGGGDFICQPRSGNIVQLTYEDNQGNGYNFFAVNGGGYARNPDGTWRSPFYRYEYPLQDNDHASFTIQANKKTGVPTAAWSGNGAENYGNVWWSGPPSPNGAPSTVLSWRGPPNGLIPIPPQYSIPGLSQADNVLNGQQYYTCFSSLVYHQGSVLIDTVTVDAGSPLVVGAWYFKGVLYVALNVSVAKAYRFRVYKQSEGKWIRVFDAVDTRAQTPCMISSDGSAFVYRATSYTVTTDVVSAGATLPITLNSLLTIVNALVGTDEAQFIFSGTQNQWPYLVGNSLQKIGVTYEGAFIPVLTGENFSNSGQTAPIYVPKYKLIVYPPEFWGPGNCFTSNGSNVKWTSSGGSIDADSGCILTQGACPVTATDCFGQVVTVTPPLANLSIIGPFVASVGAGYGVQNLYSGAAKWSVTSGSINPNTGVITVLGCGSAVVSANVCGILLTMNINWPVGMWVVVSSCVHTNCGTEVLVTEVGSTIVPAGATWYLYGSTALQEEQTCCFTSGTPPVCGLATLPYNWGANCGPNNTAVYASASVVYQYVCP